MKVVVDRTRCTGIGICESIDPDRFEIQDDGTLKVLDDEAIEPDARQLVEEAVRGCPALALSVIE